MGVFENKYKSMETKKRIYVRVLSWRIWSICVGFLVTWCVTGQLGLTLGLTLVMSTVQIFFHMVHERIWHDVKWGMYAEEKDKSERSDIKARVTSRRIRTIH